MGRLSGESDKQVMSVMVKIEDEKENRFMRLYFNQSIKKKIKNQFYTTIKDISVVIQMSVTVNYLTLPEFTMLLTLLSLNSPSVLVEIIIVLNS